jgi:hypothetical protein
MSDEDVFFFASCLRAYVNNKKGSVSLNDCSQFECGEYEFDYNTFGDSDKNIHGY